MSGTSTTVINTNSQLQANYEFSKIFLFDNKFRSINIANATGAAVTITIGQLIGTIGATGKGKVLASGSTDGSQFPTGILAETVIIPANSNKDVQICIAGEVAQEKVLLNGSDTLSTVISDRTILDRIAADTMGIKLVASTELTAFDNS